jgi:hypothetical protein
LPLAQDTLRRAYQSRNRLDRFRYSAVRWYPSGSRSLAYAAALTVAIRDDSVSSNILAGSFGPEMALIMEAGARRGSPSLAVSDQLSGQAIAYAFSEYVLIGEEVFAARAYLSESPAKAFDVVRLDLLRWLIVFAILATFFAQVLTTRGQ